jgi:hypothetical protein
MRVISLNCRAVIPVWRACPAKCFHDCELPAQVSCVSEEITEQPGARPGQQLKRRRLMWLDGFFGKLTCLKRMS